jgi:hypothetical protein
MLRLDRRRSVHRSASRRPTRFSLTSSVYEWRGIQEQFGRGQLLRYCHVSASYCISTLPLGNVVENERGCLSRAQERDGQLEAGRSMLAAV